MKAAGSDPMHAVPKCVNYAYSTMTSNKEMLTIGEALTVEATCFTGATVKDESEVTARRVRYLSLVDSQNAPRGTHRELPASRQPSHGYGNPLVSESASPNYIYRWKNNPKRAKMCGCRCRVLARGRLNSALVEFENGQREVISWNALRRNKNDRTQV